MVCKIGDIHVFGCQFYIGFIRMGYFECHHYYWFCPIRQHHSIQTYHNGNVSGITAFYFHIPMIGKSFVGPGINNLKYYKRWIFVPILCFQGALVHDAKFNPLFQYVCTNEYINSNVLKNGKYNSNGPLSLNGNVHNHIISRREKPRG